MIGMGPFGGWYDILSSHAEGPDICGYLMIDYSGYDQTVHEDLIRWAINHVRGMFTETQGANAYWESEYDNLVNMDIALPDGSVYRKSRGVSSGDPWTSQVDSLANWAATTWTLWTLGIEAKVWTFGDDVLVAITDLGGVSLNELPTKFARRVYNITGLEAKMSATYTSDRLVINGAEPVENRSPSFLSNYFMSRMDQVLPVKLTQEMFQGLAYPERNYEKHGDGTINYEWELGRVSSYYLVYYWNYAARDVIMAYHEYLISRIRSEGRLVEMSNLDNHLLKLLDIPLSAFLLEWTVRLPSVSEVIQLYQEGEILDLSGPELLRAKYSDGMAVPSEEVVPWDESG
jgi:hypothetical protein